MPTVQLKDGAYIGEGSNLFLLSGRVPGSDEDTTHLIAAADMGSAEEEFKALLHDEYSGLDLEVIYREHDCGLIFITKEHVGEFANAKPSAEDYGLQLNLDAESETDVAESDGFPERFSARMKALTDAGWSIDISAQLPGLSPTPYLLAMTADGTENPVPFSWLRSTHANQQFSHSDLLEHFPSMQIGRRLRPRDPGWKTLMEAGVHAVKDVVQISVEAGVIMTARRAGVIHTQTHAGNLLSALLKLEAKLK